MFSIDYQKLKAMGYKAIIFDIDSTLVPHGDDTTNEIDQLFKYLHKLDLRLYYYLTIVKNVFLHSIEILRLYLYLWQISPIEQII